MFFCLMVTKPDFAQKSAECKNLKNVNNYNLFASWLIYV